MCAVLIFIIIIVRNLLHFTENKNTAEDSCLTAVFYIPKTKGEPHISCQLLREKLLS